MRILIGVLSLTFLNIASGINSVPFEIISYTSQIQVDHFNDSLPNYQLTKQQNRRLFQYLCAKTLEREAQSPEKNKRLNLNLKKDLVSLKKDFLHATTPADLFYAIARLSNTRKNQHLLVKPYAKGIGAGYLEQSAHFPEQLNQAPVQLAVDYQNPDRPLLFLISWGKNSALQQSGALGDVLIGINGIKLQQYINDIDPFLNYSTKNSKWQILAQLLPRRSLLLPVHFYQKNLSLTFSKANGQTYQVNLNYHQPKDIVWEKPEMALPYPGFLIMKSWASFTLHQSTQYPKTLLLQWHSFGPALRPDIDALIDYAKVNQLLQANLIIDARYSEGGQHAPYAIQRLTNKPFLITTGNVKKSDIFPAFSNKLKEKGADERLMDWLRIESQRATDWTANVPFKLQYLPADSDGYLYPADDHFSGQLVVWLSPASGSQVDQFAAMLIDNQLAYSLGMPTGGYSNTWEWEELLFYPGTNQPLVKFAWSIGNTFRPNGEILEGNPAPVDLFFPVTRANYKKYPSLLLQRSLAYLIQ